MAVRIEKESGDLVIDGWEKGIANSPHNGLANIKNGNISTESGEITASFVRAKQTMDSTATGTGTLTYLSATRVNLNIAGSNNIFKGMWITVTNSSDTTNLPNGNYYVRPTTGGGYQLGYYYAVGVTGPSSQTAKVLVVAGGGGGGNTAATAGAGGGGGGGLLYDATHSVSSGTPYAVVVGSGGAGASIGTNTQGTSGNNSTFDNLIANGGGGGGGRIQSGSGSGSGLSGGSGGGAGSYNSAGGPIGSASGTPGQGNAGGASPVAGGGGGGGGGGGSAGANSSSTASGAGGGGGSNSITGSAVTYAGGGGGGAGSGITTSGGGAGGGGNGGTPAAAGGNGTANGGGGGGGAGTNGFAAGNGGTGIVIISLATGLVTNPTTAGGTYTTSAGQDIWTFTASGQWFPTFANTAAPTLNASGFSVGLTATIQLVATLGNPIAKATENYLNNGVQYNRYYVLDSNNRVWVYDSFNETLYASSDNVSWFLPDYQTTYCTGASGIAAFSGFVIVTATSGTYGKPVTQLGAINTQNTNWVEFYDDYVWEGFPATTHFCYVGHQGRLYITDGNYVRSIFPDSTLITSPATTAINVQSLGTWTSTTQSGFSVGIVPSTISGSMPLPSDQGALPVVFFTDGRLPDAIRPNKVYYLVSDKSGHVLVYEDPSLAFTTTVNTTGTLASAATTTTLTAPWAETTGLYQTMFTNAGGTEFRNVYYTNGSAAIIWTVPLSAATTTTALTVSNGKDTSDGAVGTQYYSTFYPISSAGDPAGVTPLYVITPQRLTLPSFEVSRCMAEIGNSVVVGCYGNVVYPWDQASNLPGTIISLPEANVVNILTVNQVAYMFAGNQGNIYITDASLASIAVNLPDYVAGIPGSPGTYIESTYTWGDAMYLRGRVYFSVLDQSAAKAGNCGGVWAFLPTQSYSIDQDTGSALRLEYLNSYGTYNGVDNLLIVNQMQNAQQPLYWSAWNSDITAPTYGIDYSTGGTSSVAPVILETDAIPVGTMLDKKTFSQVEFKLSSPLDTTATVTYFYRQDLTSAWKKGEIFKMEANRLSGYAIMNFEKGQWLQLQLVLTPITSTASTNSFVRLKEVRIR